MKLSNTQVDKLGKKLKEVVQAGQNPSEEDLELLDEFRKTHDNIDEYVFNTIEAILEHLKNNNKITIAKRKRKTSQSIIDKLIRLKSSRLSKMQDIVGCRVVVNLGTHKTQEIHAKLQQELIKDSNLEVTSKQRNNEVGYKAIHVIISYEKKKYELQLRTYAQDIWANIVEFLSKPNNKLKYGMDDENQKISEILKKLSGALENIDNQANTLQANTLYEPRFKNYQKQIEETIEDVLPN